MPGSRHSPLAPGSQLITLLLGLLAALPALSIDISQPTLLAVQNELGASVRSIGLTLTLFMVGFAAGQFGTGPLSDRFGRRRPLLACLVAYVGAGIGCATATSAQALVLCRLVQGVAAGGCVVLAFAIVRDLFEGEAARAKRSYVTALVSVAPMLAPTIGAIVLGFWGWRAVYVVLILGGAGLLTVIYSMLGETRTPVPGAPSSRLQDGYRSVMSNRLFVTTAAVNALSYGGVFAYIAGSPEVLIGTLHLSPRQYGIFFACTSIALTTGAFTSGRAGRRGMGPARLVWAGLLVGALSAVGLAAVVAVNQIGVTALLALLVVNLFCRGLTVPNAQHLALEPIREHAGTAAAALGVMQILTGAAASALVAVLLPSLGPGGMAYVMAGFGLASLAAWAFLVPRGA